MSNENPFHEMTLEQAKANDMWDWIKINENSETLTIAVSMSADFELKREELTPELVNSIDKLFVERIGVDINELVVVMKHKLADHIQPK